MASTHPFLFRMKQIQFLQRIGYVTRVCEGHVESSGPMCAVGDLCEIQSSETAHPVMAQVIGVEFEHIILSPFDQTATITPDSRVVACRIENKIPVGDQFGGRAIDALGRAIDGHQIIFPEAFLPSAGTVLKPLERAESKTILQTGIRAMDGLLPIGLGQRIGVFAASGVGKTTLMKQLVSQVECDRCVLCLVGERGKEVESFWSELGEDKRYTCVAATSDQSAALRARSVSQALCLAEYWRAQGEDVLLVIDSVTRFAMALREIGLAAGAPPTLRAYTPNVFAALPRIVERCGKAKAGGSITAIMTVLSETDDVDDPIVEVMKSLLDGHIILSRRLAEQGHFPAIDVVKSISRQSEDLMSDQHKAASKDILSMMSAYDEARVMIDSGIYRTGANQNVDRAITARPKINAFLQQGRSDVNSVPETIAQIEALREVGNQYVSA